VYLNPLHFISQARVHQRAVWAVTMQPAGREYEACMLLSTIALSKRYVDALAHTMRYCDGRKHCPGPVW
jgi:hypothetical protein